MECGRRRKREMEGVNNRERGYKVGRRRQKGMESGKNMEEEWGERRNNIGAGCL